MSADALKTQVGAIQTQVESIDIGVAAMHDKVDIVSGTTKAIATDVQMIRAAVVSHF